VATKARNMRFHHIDKYLKLCINLSNR